MIQARRYQQRCVENYKKWITSSERLATIILVTGGGKTFTACLCLNETPELKVLWVAHRSELIHQAKLELEAVITNRSIQIEMAEEKASPTADIVVGSVQTLARQRKNLETFKPDIIVIDEYHHYSENNIQYDGLLKRWPESKVLGLTATPWRPSGEELPVGEILIQMDIGTAVSKGYLVPPVGETLYSDISLAEVGTRLGDFEIKALSETINVSSRNDLIAKKVLQLVKEQKRQGILFGADVAHSKAMYQLLKNEVRAGEVYGDTPLAERQELIKKINNREIDVIFNNCVLVEGFNAPHLSFVTIARPTRSLQLFLQMVGRGLRLSENKKNCIIVDIYDKMKVKQSRVTFHDMATSGDLYGDKKRATSILAADVPLEAKTKLINFPILMRPDKQNRWMTDDESFSITSWAISPNQWIATWTKENKIQKTISKTAWINLSTIDKNTVLVGKTILHKDFGDGTIQEVVETGENFKVKVIFGWGDERIVMAKHLKYQSKVKEDLPGQFDIVKEDKLFYICLPDMDETGRLLMFERQGKDLIIKKDLRCNREQIDIFLRDEATKDNVLSLIKTTAKWKRDPASESQKKFIASLKAKLSFDLDLDTLTKGEASSVLEQNKWQSLILDKFGVDSTENLLGYNKGLHDL